MDISVVSPLKVFLKNNLFSDVVLHVYKISNPLEDGEERTKMENLNLNEDMSDEEGCHRKKRKCPSTCTPTSIDSKPPPEASSLLPPTSPCRSTSPIPSPTSPTACTKASESSNDTSLTSPFIPICPSPPPPPGTVLNSSQEFPEVTNTVKELGPLPQTPIFSSLPEAARASAANTTTTPQDMHPDSSATSDEPVVILLRTNNITNISTPHVINTTSTTTTTTTTSTTASTSHAIPSLPPCPTATTTDCNSKKSQPIPRPSLPASTNAAATTSPKPVISLNGHRCVLAAQSKFFYMMFSNGMKESFEKEVKVYVEDVPSFEKMFEYFYTGIIDFKSTNLLKMLELCLQFDVPRLCCDVGSYLGSNLTLGNAFELYEFSRTRLEPTNSLSVKALDFVLSNFFHIFRGYPSSICYLSHTSLKEILKSDKLNVSMEFYAFMALRFWAEHTNAKECEIKELLPAIRFAQIDVDRLRNLVRPSKLGVVCPELFKHYMDALEYHASSLDMQPILSICEDWKKRRDFYRNSEFISFKWKFKWSGLTSWVYNWTHLQGYKLFATLGKHEDGTFGMYFVPSANEQKQFCLKAELKVYLTNEENVPLCPELKLEPTIFKSDSKTPLNSIAKGWATKIVPSMLINDIIVMKIKARICES